MKKFLACFLLLAMCVGCVSCMDTGYQEETNGTIIEELVSDKQESVVETDSVESGDAPIEETKTKFDATKFKDVTYYPYSEGKALVCAWYAVDRVYHTDWYCIDKAGNIVFALERPGSANAPTGFYNGISMIGGTYLYDETGRVIKPEDVGGTAFLVDSYDEYTFEMFKDGYIILEKTTTDFTGSVTELAVINSDMEIVVDFSVEFYELYNYTTSWTYYDGYLYDGAGYRIPDCVIDLRTGKKIADVVTWTKNLPLERRLNRSGDTYYDITVGEGTPVIDLSQYKDTLYGMGDFIDGTAVITFESNNTDFFTLINTKGEFLFAPIQFTGVTPWASVDHYVKRCDGVLLVFSLNPPNQIFTVYDQKGNKLAEKVWKGDAIVEYGDGVILFTPLYENGQYLDMNFQPLF